MRAVHVVLDTAVREHLDDHVAGLLGANPGMAAKDVAKLIRLDEIPLLTGFSGATLRECNRYAKKQIMRAKSLEKKASGREDKLSELVYEYDKIRLSLDAKLAEFERMGGDPADFAKKAKTHSAEPESHDPKKRQNELIHRNKLMKKLLGTVQDGTRTLNRKRTGLVNKSNGLAADLDKLDAKLDRLMSECARLGGDCTDLARRRRLVADVPPRGDETSIGAVNKRHDQLMRRHNSLLDLIDSAESAIGDIEARRRQMQRQCAQIKKECTALEADLDDRFERCRQLGGKRADLVGDLEGIRGGDAAVASPAPASTPTPTSIMPVSGTRSGGRKDGAEDLNARHRLLEGRRNRLVDLKKRTIKWITMLENLECLKNDVNSLARRMEQTCEYLASTRTGIVLKDAMGITPADTKTLCSVIRDASSHSWNAKTAARGGATASGGATSTKVRMMRVYNDSLEMLGSFVECLEMLVLYNDVDGMNDQKGLAMSGPDHVKDVPPVSTDLPLSIEVLKDGLEALRNVTVIDIPDDAARALHTRLVVLHTRLAKLRTPLRAVRANLKTLRVQLGNETDALNEIHTKWEMLVRGVSPSGNDQLCKVPRQYAKAVSSVRMMSMPDGNLTQMIGNMGGNGTAINGGGSGPNLLLDSSTIISMYWEINPPTVNMYQKHIHKHIHKYLEEMKAKLIITNTIIRESSPILDMDRVDLEDWLYDQFDVGCVEIARERDKQADLDNARKIYDLDVNRLSVYIQNGGDYYRPDSDRRREKLMALCANYRGRFKHNLNVFFKRHRFRKLTYESIQYTSQGMADRILSEPDCLLLYMHCTRDDMVLITQDHDLVWSCMDNAGLENPRDASSYNICSRFEGVANSQPAKT